MRSEAGSLWSLAAGLVSDFPLSKQKTHSPNSSLKKKGRNVEAVRILLWCVSTHRFSPAFCEWRVQFRWVFFSVGGRRRRFERDAASKASKLGKGNQQLRASERRGRSQGAHGYWLNSLGHCVCGCVAVVWVVG